MSKKGETFGLRTPTFGKNWNIRIINTERDFYYVVDGAVKFTLLKNRTEKESQL